MTSHARQYGSRSRQAVLVLVAVVTSGIMCLLGQSGTAVAGSLPGKAQTITFPPAPKPEPISLSELPVPATAPSTAVGSCTNQTGCISSVAAGGFIDATTVVASFTYAGAPAAPDPRSIYSGTQLALIKTDGSNFPDGDPWQCITCGVPAANMTGATAPMTFAHPFRDRRRIMAGTNIVDCSPYLITSTRCTADKIHIYPVHWQVTPDDSGPGGTISTALALNPDQVHAGWNVISIVNGAFVENAYFGRLTFDAHPSAGTPLVARYDLTNVSVLHNSVGSTASVHVDPSNPTQLDYTPGTAIGSYIGEFKGFTGNGREVLGIGIRQSGNLDHFATSLASGHARRLDADPGYSDPDTSSPDSQWTVTMDVRYQNRFWFIAGMPGVPPIIDSAAGAAAFAGYNIGQRRLFQPFLEDRFGDRGNYHGQQLNACTTGPCTTLATGPESTADSPLWGSMADSYWSPDQTAIVWGQVYASPGTCGPPYDAIACPATTTEPGGRTSRLMIARLTGRHPRPSLPVSQVSDTVPWAMPYHPGDAAPAPVLIPSGTYTLKGKLFGKAQVTFTQNAAGNAYSSASVTYNNYTDDGINVINGTETVIATPSANPLLGTVTYHDNLVLSGAHTGSQTTSEPGGYTIAPTASLAFGQYRPVGTMTTIIDGTVYNQPPND